MTSVNLDEVVIDEELKERLVKIQTDYLDKIKELSKDKGNTEEDVQKLENEHIEELNNILEEKTGIKYAKDVPKDKFTAWQKISMEMSNISDLGMVPLNKKLKLTNKPVIPRGMPGDSMDRFYGGKRKTRRNRKSKKSRKGKSRKNRRKSNRRR